jgi:hypothetical protein
MSIEQLGLRMDPAARWRLLGILVLDYSTPEAARTYARRVPVVCHDCGGRRWAATGPHAARHDGGRLVDCSGREVER